MIHTDTRPGTVRDAVFQLLRDLGITTLFGNPGSTELPMFHDFPKDFRYIMGLQELCVVGMADGFTRASGNAACVNLHSAAGLGHALGGIYTARKNQSPLIVIAGQQARSILPFDPFLSAERATDFPRPYVKWACEPARAQDVPAAVARAYYTAMQSPRGPTFVSVPVDDWDRPCDGVVARRVSRTVCGDVGLLSALAEALARAERPAIVAGPAIAIDDAWHEVVALAEMHCAAVYASPLSGRNGFPEEHGLFAGFLEASRERIVATLRGHDLILVLGAPAFTYHVEGPGPVIPPGSELYQLVNDPALSTWAPVGTAIVTDLKCGIATLLRGTAPRRRAVPKARSRMAPPKSDVLSPRYLMARIAGLRPGDSLIVEEAPSSRQAMQALLPMNRANQFHTSSSGALGFGLPGAVGLALGSPGSHVIAILGDGSTMYASQGLWTAAQLGLPICFVIIRNKRYRALDMFGALFDLRNTPDWQLPSLDFCALAEAHGVRAIAVNEPAQLDPALTEGFASDSPYLIEVNVTEP